MTEIVAQEQHTDVLKRELLSRYLEINTVSSALTSSLFEKYRNPHKMIRETSKLKVMIINIVGIAKVADKKFYAAIESNYLKFYNYRIGRTFSRAKYDAETALQIWEIIKNEMVEHNVIDVKGE